MDTLFRRNSADHGRATPPCPVGFVLPDLVDPMRPPAADPTTRAVSAWAVGRGRKSA